MTGVIDDDGLCLPGMTSLHCMIHCPKEAAQAWQVGLQKLQVKNIFQYGIITMHVLHQVLVMN